MHLYHYTSCENKVDNEDEVDVDHYRLWIGHFDVVNIRNQPN